MSLILHGSYVLSAALLLAALAGAAVYYRRTVPAVPRGPRATLAGLRMLAVALLIAALFEPLMHRVWTGTRDPRVVVLVDNSQSMGIVDAREDRAAAARGVIEALRRHPKRSLLEGVLFSDST